MRDHLPPLSMVPSLYEVATAIRSRMIGWNVVSNSTSWVVQLISWFFVRPPARPRPGHVELSG